jgi:hypothetical protein
VTKAAYDRMLAQVHNDAKGWDDPAYAPYANSEPADPKDIKGNFTKEELPASRGYALPVGIGHAGDYNGYTVSYREYMSRDSYRKALTSYGPHTADYMVTRLVRVAGALKGGADLAEGDQRPAGAGRRGPPGGERPHHRRHLRPAYDAWRASLPADVGPVAALTQPKDLERFGAATFTWRGGSNAVDNPVVRVERQVDGAWQAVRRHERRGADPGRLPEGRPGRRRHPHRPPGVALDRRVRGVQRLPARIGSTPAGTYRFVVDGVSRHHRQRRARTR